MFFRRDGVLYADDGFSDKRQMIRYIGFIIWNSTLMYFNNIEEILIQEL
jgi:histidinol phosphatase-like enzyme